MIISVVLVKGQSKLVTRYMGPWRAGGWERAPQPSPLISALHSSPNCTAIQLPVHDCDLVGYTKTTLRTIMIDPQ